jgi:hypothetical protein
MKLFFPACFQPFFRKIGGRTATNFLLPEIFFSGLFCVIWPEKRPSGNSVNSHGFVFAP